MLEKINKIYTGSTMLIELGLLQNTNAGDVDIKLNLKEFNELKSFVKDPENKDFAERKILVSLEIMEDCYDGVSSIPEEYSTGHYESKFVPDYKNIKQYSVNYGDEIKDNYFTFAHITERDEYNEPNKVENYCVFLYENTPLIEKNNILYEHPAITMSHKALMSKGDCKHIRTLRSIFNNYKNLEKYISNEEYKYLFEIIHQITNIDTDFSLFKDMLYYQLKKIR